MLDWIAASVVFVIGAWGIWQFVRYNLKDYDEWVKEEQYRNLAEEEDFIEPWDMTS
jgi:putative Mn2+ efflux pump MntP